MRALLSTHDNPSNQGLISTKRRGMWRPQNIQATEYFDIAYTHEEKPTLVYGEPMNFCEYSYPQHIYQSVNG